MATVRFVRDRARHAGAVERLLAAADDEFVPSLTGSRRAGVSRSGEESGAGTLADYVDRCLERPMVGAFDGDDLVGFSSFHPLERAAALDGYTPTNHVSILIVDSAYRGRGIARSTYRHLLTALPADRRRPHVSTKTWSTNHAHLHVLDTLEFACVERIPDDRGAGVDTVYYARQTPSADRASADRRDP